MNAALGALVQDEDTASPSSIEARLAPLLRTARGRFLFLKGGGVGLLLRRLKKEAARPRPSSLLLLPWCRLLALCCRDEESAVALGLMGGHPSVKRLLEIEIEGARDGDEEEAAEAVVECAAGIASRCSLVRGGFPLR